MKILTIHFLIFFGAFIQVHANTKFDPNLSFLDKKGIEITKMNSSGNSSKISHVEFVLDKLVYTIEVIAPISAENALPIVNNSLFILLRSFEATPTPYVGQITKIQDCNSISKPNVTNIESKGLQIKLMSFSTDSSLRPGLCIPKKLSIEVCQSSFYVSKLKSLIKIKSISREGERCLKFTRKYLEELNF
jgi:hypothetical protein